MIQQQLENGMPQSKFRVEISHITCFYVRLIKTITQMSTCFTCKTRRGKITGMGREENCYDCDVFTKEIDTFKSSLFKLHYNAI